MCEEGEPRWGCLGDREGEAVGILLLVRLGMEGMHLHRLREGTMHLIHRVYRLRTLRPILRRPIPRMRLLSSTLNSYLSTTHPHSLSSINNSSTLLTLFHPSDLG